MPKVPEYNHKKIERIYTASEEPMSLKQKNLIITLHERRKLPVPDMSKMTKREAAAMISLIMNDEYYKK